MTKQQADVRWDSEMAFTASVAGHEIKLDLPPEENGRNLGPKPKPLLMVALAGCTAMDVVSILKKMRVEFDYFNIRAEGDIAEEHPKRYLKIHLVYEFRGKDLPLDKLQKAIHLSHERYCGISATLEKAVEITSEIRILS
jgi:putative redox protein